jgi:carbamoylphosphate synthase large subunit
LIPEAGVSLLCRDEIPESQGSSALASKAPASPIAQIARQSLPLDTALDEIPNDYPTKKTPGLF